MRALDNIGRWLWLGSALMPLMAAGAGAQVQYRVTDLGALGFTPDPDGEGTFGINDKGEVAYSKVVNGQRRAMVWFPRPSYGRAQGNHDIEAIFGSSAHPSIAREINDAGQIAGQVNGLLVKQGQGVRWDLALANRTLTGFLPTGDWSRGTSINLGGQVLGESEGLSRFCSPCNSSGTSIDTLRALSWPPMTELTPLLSCPQLSDNVSGVGDIADNGLMVGYSDLFWLTPNTCLTSCASRDAVIWVNATAIFPLPDLGPTFPSEARGVSANGARIVGWGSDSSCPDYNALFWQGLQTPTVLRTNSRAQAVNMHTLAEVVGWDVPSNAVHWRMTGGGGWQTTLLISAVNGAAYGISSLKQAHDINEDGWIITWGYPVSAPTAPHAYVLTPFGSCPADITGPPGGSGAPPDGTVNVVDMNELFAEWGPCPPELYRPADINGDNVVNVVDHNLLLAAWGPCP